MVDSGQFRGKAPACKFRRNHSSAVSCPNAAFRSRAEFPVALCNACRESFPLKSNVEELSRMLAALTELPCLCS